MSPGGQLSALACIEEDSEGLVSEHRSVPEQGDSDSSVERLWASVLEVDLPG